MYLRSLFLKACLLVITFLYLVSCTESYKPQEGEILMTIEIPLGSDFVHIDGEKEIKYLPFLVNEGSATFDDRIKKIALIGTKLKEGQEVYVKPVAKLKYVKDGSRNERILAIPAEEKYRTIEIDSYESLLTEYFSTKQMLEYWYSNRYGLGGVSDISWASL